MEFYEGYIAVDLLKYGRDRKVSGGVVFDVNIPQWAGVNNLATSVRCG